MSTVQRSGTRYPRDAPRDVQRRAVLDAASRILVDEGAGALSTRRVATDLGASTMVIYSLFDSKDRLMDALVVEGFRRFADALAEPREDDPFAHLRALGGAYRRFALENQTYYRLLWSHEDFCAQDGAERAEARRHGDRAFAALTSALLGVMAALDRPARDIRAEAMNVWSQIHGFVSLELAGVVGGSGGQDADVAFASMQDFTERALRAGR